MLGLDSNPPRCVTRPTAVFRRLIAPALLTTLLLAGVAAGIPLARAETAIDLNREADTALQSLYRSNPAALALSRQARGILVFPKIIKAGLVLGGAYGEGVLKGTAHDGYFNSVSASWGWQAGAESYGYVVFLMTPKALEYLDKSKGLEIGVGPTVVAVNAGVARNLTTTTLKDDAYAFIFDQQGLMASLSIEGTKITRIKR